MNAENRELLEEVINKKLAYALIAQEGSEEESKALKEAMAAIDRAAEISKNDDSYQEKMEALEVEKAKLENDKIRLENEKAKLENDMAYREAELEQDKLKIENDNLYRKQELAVEKAKIKEGKANRLSDSTINKIQIATSIGLKVIEIGAVVLLAPMLDRKFKSDFARDCMMWEDEHTFTTTPGRSVKDIFKLK